MNDQKTAIVLGGTVPHGELIKELKNRGYTAILVDYFADPPAARYADIHYRESAMDLQAVLKIARQHEADLVISSCLDQQMNIAMKVAEELGLKHPFSAEVCENVTNKGRMKKIMMDHGIPTAQYHVIDQETDLDHLQLSDTVIIKPEDSCGSAGVSKVSFADKTRIKEAIHKACSFGTSGNAIIEDYIEGTEMGVHGYVQDGSFHLIFGTCKISVIDGDMTRQLCNLYLPEIRTSLKEKLLKIANDIVKAFRLPADTPLFMQVIVRDDEVFVIEFSPRVAGGTSSEVARDYAGFDSLVYSIDSYLGAFHEVETPKLSRYVCCFPLYAKAGILGKIGGPKALSADKTVDRVILLKHPGDPIGNDKPSSANVLKYILSGSSYEECYEKTRRADEMTEILDQDGNSLRTEKGQLTHELLVKKLSELL